MAFFPIPEMAGLLNADPLYFMVTVTGTNNRYISDLAKSSLIEIT